VKTCTPLDDRLEAYELAFAFFCGVFRRLRYDNLKAAVKKISAAVRVRKLRAEIG
jgi:hypothetical protein